MFLARQLWRCGALGVAASLTVVSADSPTRADVATAPARELNAEPSPPRPLEFRQIQQVVDRHFARIPKRKQGMLISKGDVLPILDELRLLGWQIPDEQKLVQQLLDDSHFLVQQLRTPLGQSFMAKVSSEDLIYDRLQRISEERGGQQLIRDLIKLPDAEKYAKKKTARAVPNLVDFLPKDETGTTRRVKDYDRPTGRIYTQDALLKRLAELHRQSTDPVSKSRPPRP